MTIRYIDYVLRCGRVFERAEHALLVSLANNANEHGFAWPSEGELAWNSSLSERHVRRVLKKLEWFGAIFINKGVGRQTNRYRLNTVMLEQMAAEITRVKKKSLQVGVDRYAEMDRVAHQIREQLEFQARQRKALNGDTESGQSKFVMHEDHSELCITLPSQAARSTQRGHPADNADTVSDSSSHDVRQTVNKHINNPHVNMAAVALIVADDVSPEGNTDRSPHHGERANRIGELATKLGMTDLELMHRAGGPAAADQLARGAASGKMNLQQLAEALAQTD